MRQHAQWRLRTGGALLLAGLLLTRLAIAQEAADDFTRRITDELRRRSPAAAEAFHAANTARDSQDFRQAEMLYRRVVELAPGFNHATRRLCGVVLQQGRRDEALLLCRQAFEMEASPENRSLLAAALIYAPEGATPPPADVREAVAHASVLAALPQSDVNEFLTVCQVATAADSLQMLRHCVTALDRIAPSEVPTQYFGWLLAVSQRQWDSADQRLEQARAAGLPAPEYARLKQITDEARPRWPRYARAGATVGGYWLLGLGLLLVVGWLLSRIALSTARRPLAVERGESTGVDAAIRQAYRVVLWLCCLYYYLSIPLVLVAVVVGGGAIIYAFFALGHIPIKLVVVVVAVVAVTVWAMIKSLFFRVHDQDPGLKLDVSEHPRFRDLLKNVAGQIGTRAVDNVYLTPGAELAVTERGGMGRQLRGSAERCLILGIGLLEDLKVGPFKAVLAHEYGHFSNRDTAGGGFALAVRASLIAMATGIARGGAAAWYNPAWLFVVGFYKVFLRISQGASRLQEVLADRWAAFVYGARQFEQGLRHVIERSVRFNVHANATLAEVIEGHKALVNLYAYRPAQQLSEEEIEKAVQAAVDAEPSPYDSHPAPRDRIAWVHALPATLSADLGDADQDAWSLFSHRGALEVAMTNYVRANVQRAHGVLIPDREPEAVG